MAGSPVVEFYAGRQPDYLGRTLDEILGWDDERLESIHDFIQVLFPNFESSGVTPEAPTLTLDALQAFATDAGLRGNLLRAFDRLLAFYGLTSDARSGEIGPAANFVQRAPTWLSPHNHNYLRITRILKCLGCLALPHVAAAFLRGLFEVYGKYGSAIGPATLSYWREAVRDPSGGRLPG
jgi:hypothetical protein